MCADSVNQGLSPPGYNVLVIRVPHYMVLYVFLFNRYYTTVSYSTH